MGIVINRREALLLLAVCGSTLATSAGAETLADFFGHGSVGGELRSYYYNRQYKSPKTPNQDAFAIGGMLNVQTADFLDGFAVGGSFFTAHALGTQSDDPKEIDTTLIGPRNSITALGQAYVQYRGYHTLLRLGDQLLNTPFANPSDGRILPATYQAAYVESTPLPGLTLYGLRIFRYKSRTSTDYFRDDNYYASTWGGDSAYGGIAKLPASTPASSGTLGFGTQYKLAGATAHVWYYDFYQRAHLAYGDAQYDFHLGGVTPYVGGQYARNWGNETVFATTGTALLGQPSSSVSATIYGGTAGIKYAGATLSINYNRLDPQATGAVGGGAVISPYTASYVTDPFYTSSMIRGLVELGPGSAWKVKATFDAFDKQLSVMTSFARYRTYYSGNDNETYLDIIYAPKQLKGFALRDRVEVANGNVNPGQREFIYNRVQATYAF